MLGARRHREAGPIGVDVGAHSIKMVQLAGQGERQRIVAAASRALPPEVTNSSECVSGATGGLSASADAPARSALAGKPPVAPVQDTFSDYHDAVTAAVREMLACEPFVGRRAVSALPTWSLHVKNIRLPRMPADELAQAVRWEAAERLGETPMEVQFFNAGEVRQGEELRQEIIVLAAPSAFVQGHVESLIDAGLRPEAVEAVPAALRRALLANSPPRERGVQESLHVQQTPPSPGTRGAIGEVASPPLVIVDVGYHATAVVIAQGQRVLFFKLIEIGGRRLDEAVAQQLHVSLDEAAVLRRRVSDDGHDGVGVPPAAAQPSEMMQAVRPLLTDLSREVALCLRYYSVTFRGQRPASAVLAGGEAAQPMLKALLGEHAAVAVEMARLGASMADEKWSMEACGGAGFAGLPGAGPAAWATAAGLALHRGGAAAAQRRAA